jgi:hypothetical protein
MKNEKWWWLVGGILIGALFCWGFHKWSDENDFIDSDKCCTETAFAPYCEIKSDTFKNEPINPDNADIMYGAYYNTNPTDAIGFTMDKELSNKIANHLLSNPALIGARFYPGLNGTDENIIVTFLEFDQSNPAAYKEIPSNVFSENKQFVARDYKINRGPCPRWCDVPSRTVIRPR